MKEITISVDGQEIKAQISEEELKKLMQEPEWPQVGDTYWWIVVTGEISPMAYAAYEVDKEIQLLGNMYRTKQGALDAIRARKLITAVARRRKELNGDWKPEWEDNEAKQQIVFWEGEISIDAAYSSIIASPFGVYKTKTSAAIIIEEFRDELEWYFTEYTVSVN